MTETASQPQIIQPALGAPTTWIRQIMQTANGEIIVLTIAHLMGSTVIGMSPEDAIAQGEALVAVGKQAMTGIQVVGAIPALAKDVMREKFRGR